MWDHFSWYIPCEAGLIRDIEALLLSMLPFPLRVLNRQKGKLKGADKIKQPATHRTPDFITRKMPARRKS